MTDHTPRPDSDDDDAPQRSSDMTHPAGTTDSTDTDATRADQPLFDPLPYSSGYTAPQPAVPGYGYEYGYGVAPEPSAAASPAAWSAASPASVPTSLSTSVPDEAGAAGRGRAGSPVLAVAGVLSLGVAGWAILGAPVITPTVMLTAGLVLMVVVGLVMVIRL